MALSLVVAGCERSTTSGPRTRATAPSTSPPPPAAPAVVLSRALSRPEAATVVAIGDLHGDLAATRRALRLAGAIDGEDRWIGGALVVVQTGDVIDRGDEDKEVLELLDRLRGEASAAGGELILLWGNHELMNTVGDLRYVTEASLAAFGGPQGRFDAFKPGGPFAALLDARRLLVKVGDTVFAHGGILPAHIAYGLDRMNDEIHAWLQGKLPSPPAAAVVEDGVLWTRAYSLDPVSCEALAEALTALSAKRMVVGHTVHLEGVHSACDGRVWWIDTGMSRFYGGPVQVLELGRDGPAVRREGP